MEKAIPKPIDYNIIHKEIIKHIKLNKYDIFGLKKILNRYKKQHMDFKSSVQVQQNIVRGFFEWSNGDEYSGDWSGNEMHGDGEYKWENGLIYKGKFSHNKINRRGHFYINNIEIDSKSKSNKILEMVF